MAPIQFSKRASACCTSYNAKTLLCQISIVWFQKHQGRSSFNFAAKERTIFSVYWKSSCRSQWPRGLRHELSSPARTLGSWVRIQLKARTFVCDYSVCIRIGLETGWSPIQQVVTTILGLGKWSETKHFTDTLCSKVGAREERERERERGRSHPVLVFSLYVKQATWKIRDSLLAKPYSENQFTLFLIILIYSN
jgi:hypothetical protein